MLKNTIIFLYIKNLNIFIGLGRLLSFIVYILIKFIVKTMTWAKLEMFILFKYNCFLLHSRKFKYAITQRSSERDSRPKYGRSSKGKFRPSRCANGHGRHC